MRRTTTKMAATLAASLLILSACGERPADEDASASPSAEESTSAAAEIDFKACMVSDSGGFDDKSFNETSLKGQSDAVTQFGVQTAQAESAGDAEYVDNIQGLVDEGCNEITSVGFKLGDATFAAAEENPDIDFAIVDFAFTDEEGNDTSLPNTKGLVFETAEPSYLAGYIAASSSQTGTVGTFGGLNIPTVTIFMDGFLQGVERYNEDNGTDVSVLGWDGTDGQFTEDFEDTARGQQVGEQLVQQGADVIFPVAGPAGLGGLQAAEDADVKGIWVDSDGCESTEYCDILLTSVQKGMDVAVTNAIGDAVEGDFTNELYVGTLENEGVKLGPISDDVDPEVVAKVEEMQAAFIDGSLTLD